MIPLIIEPDVLADLMLTQDLLLVDLSSAQTYNQVHLSGAIHVQPSELISGVQPAVGKLPRIDQLRALFSRIGYNPDQHIVAYDDEGGGWAGRFIWTLDIIGHQKTSYLNGGIHAWLETGLPTTSDLPTVSTTDVDISINDEYLATKADVLKSLDDPKSVIWDARTPEEYSGSKVVAARGGRIPGAVNLEWTQAMDRNHQLRIRPDIAEVLAQLGISGEKDIITHCQTHHRSGFTYLVGKSLGYRIRAYDGSWAEWGNDPNTPIEVG